MAKYSKRAGKKVEKTMHEMKQGKLKTGSGKKVTSRKQAIAIGLSEAREEGEKVPKRSGSKSSGGKAKTATKKLSTKKASTKSSLKSGITKSSAGSKSSKSSGSSKRGLASASKATRKRVASKGGKS